MNNISDIKKKLAGIKVRIDEEEDYSNNFEDKVEKNTIRVAK